MTHIGWCLLFSICYIHGQYHFGSALPLYLFEEEKSLLGMKHLGLAA